MPREEESESYRRQLKSPDVAFVFADSLLSRNVGDQRMPVAESAEKIFDVPIVISVPRFDPVGAPNGGYEERYRFSCGVSYAGSSAMCQLVLERFRREMLTLRYTWVSNGYGSPGNYAICHSGSPEDINSPRSEYIEYADNIDFLSSDLPPLRADFVANQFQRCFNLAIQDHFPKEDKISGYQRELDIEIDFVLLTFCLDQRAPKIFKLGWELNHEEFPKGFKATCVPSQVEDLVVLGHCSWRSDLLASRNEAVRAGEGVTAAVRMQLERLLIEHRAGNSVGGKLRAGKLDSYGFTKYD